MARFKNVYARRSDGKLEILVKGKRKESNEPMPDQLDTTPDKHGVSDYYREVAPEEMKSLDWRRKLGGMLARELRCERDEYGFMLAVFPENYRLYEHVKKTVKDGKTEVKSKTHAAGGADRQDAYLYGHPEGRKKRFRSPVEFFPHLLWLATDETSDPDNCGCKICSPEDLEAAIPGAKVKAERPVKQERESIQVAYAPPLHQRSISGVPANALSSRVNTEPLTSTRPTPTTSTLAPTPLPKPRTSDQQLDRQYFNFMYRAGELVWFKRGQAWGLGAILRRWATMPGHSDQYHYSVQPLSYPGHTSTTVVKSDDQEFRPWLAWSVPKFTHDGLNGLQNAPHYDNADWQGMGQKKYGHGEMEVDASILAAKAVDATYSPFGHLRTTEPEPGVAETHYNGLFLGAEKIWVGDPVRLQPGTGTDIMIVHDVVERKRTSAPSSPPSVHLSGDVYTLTSVPHRPGDANPNIPSAISATAAHPYLPARLIEDLRDRNNRSIAARGVASYWKLLSAQTPLGLDAIKGRWYEASLLLPVLQQATYDAMARKGEIQEASLWMNARGDCQNSNRPPQFPRLPKPNIRKEPRELAFGAALPAGAEIREGVQPPLVGNIDPALEGGDEGEMRIDPKFDTADDGGVRQTAGAHGGASLDEFMDLDGANMPGFGNEYPSQTSQGGYF
ncbi:hypothetical protein LTR53_003649 [Teratosphaeriaceae sp. CCFEE 6253]|nr:hypothetical protein LTR53_003649 [Teratosphaeriaceae sp. CCFEE 6253]